MIFLEGVMVLVPRWGTAPEVRAVLDGSWVVVDWRMMLGWWWMILDW